MDENQNASGQEKGPPPLNQDARAYQPNQSSTTQLQSAMEVHHHGHVHEQKKWKEYIFQFIMLFLAVFLGFFAENLREKNVERNIEKEYIESLMTDAKSDLDIASRTENGIFLQAKSIDTLEHLFFAIMIKEPKRDSLVRKCYNLSANISSVYSEFFNERTISQLLSSGNMRLIKKTGVADSIMDYHSFIKFVEVQKQIYMASLNTALASMYDVYDITYLKTILVGDEFHYRDVDSIPIDLLTDAPPVLKKFNAVLEIAKTVASTYKDYLRDMMVRSKRLNHFLQDRYDIKENELSK